MTTTAVLHMFKKGRRECEDGEERLETRYTCSEKTAINMKTQAGVLIAIKKMAYSTCNTVIAYSEYVPIVTRVRINCYHPQNMAS